MTDIVSVPRTDIVQVEFLMNAEQVVKDVVANKDFETGFQFINDLHAQGSAFDDAIGMMLNGMGEVWTPDEHEGESFRDAIARTTNLSQATIRRHLKIQKALPYIPSEYREEFQEMDIKSRERVAELFVSGWEMENSDIRDLVEAPNHREVDRVARRIQGKEPRSNYTCFSIDENGLVYIHTGGQHRQLGRLFVESDDPIVKKGVDIIVSRSKIEDHVEY